MDSAELTALGSLSASLTGQAYNHRRRREGEKKAKVVASVWGAEFIQFLAALAVLLQSVWKKM